MKNFALVLALLTAATVSAQSTPPTQHFVMSTMAGTFGGDPVAIVSTGVQLTADVSIAYEFISNPNDSSKPRVGSGLVNYTTPLSSFFPKGLKKKLLIDLTNYNLTFQGGAGVESLSQGVGLPRQSQVVGNFGIYPSYPLPGGHAQLSVGYKWIVGGHGGLVKVPGGQLLFTF